MSYKCFHGESPENSRKTGIWHTGGNYPRWNSQAPNTWLKYTLFELKLKMCIIFLMSYKCFHGESPAEQQKDWHHDKQGELPQMKFTGTQYLVNIYFVWTNENVFYLLDVLQVFSWWKPWEQQKDWHMTHRGELPQTKFTGTQYLAKIYFVWTKIENVYYLLDVLQVFSWWNPWEQQKNWHRNA